MYADFGIATIKMVGSLIVILALIIGLFVLMTRLRLNSFSNNRFPNMRILGNLNLAPKRSLALIEICDQWLLVGVGTDSVTLIKEIQRPSEENETQATERIGNRGFHSLFQNIISHTDNKNRMGIGKDA